MIVNQVTSMTGQVEVVAMEGRMTVHIAVLLAQCTEGHDLVLTMVVQRVFSMVHMAGAGVLFVIAIEGNALTLFLFDLHMVALLSPAGRYFH